MLDIFNADILSYGLGSVILVSIIMLFISKFLSGKSKSKAIETLNKFKVAKAEEKIQEITSKTTEVVVRIQEGEKLTKEAKEEIKKTVKEANEKVEKILNSKSSFADDVNSILDGERE